MWIRWPAAGALARRVLGAADPTPIDVGHVRVAVDHESARVLDLDEEGRDADLHVPLSAVAKVEYVPAEAPPDDVCEGHAGTAHHSALGDGCSVCFDALRLSTGHERARGRDARTEDHRRRPRGLSRTWQQAGIRVDPDLDELNAVV